MHRRWDGGGSSIAAAVRSQHRFQLFQLIAQFHHLEVKAEHYLSILINRNSNLLTQLSILSFQLLCSA